MNEKKINCPKNYLVIKKECSLDIYTKILDCSIVRPKIRAFIPRRKNRATQ